jgi:hypothetical protein
MHKVGHNLHLAFFAFAWLHHWARDLSALQLASGTAVSVQQGLLLCMHPMHCLMNGEPRNGCCTIIIILHSTLILSALPEQLALVPGLH